MRRVVFFFVLITLMFSGPVLAETCGVTNNWELNKCGPSGGCAVGDRCVPSPAPATWGGQYGTCEDGEPYGCVQPDDFSEDDYNPLDPGFTCIVGKCGGEAGCPPDTCCYDYSAGYSTGYRCSKPPTIGDDKMWNVEDPEYAGPRITTIPQVLTPIARILFYGGLFIGLGAVVLSGYMLMVSEGDPRKTQEAKSQLTAAIVGLLFILLSSAILRVIINSLLGLSY
ncbi:pilin [Patescibacteria group bacterium]